MNSGKSDYGRMNDIGSRIELAEQEVNDLKNKLNNEEYAALQQLITSSKIQKNYYETKINRMDIPANKRKEFKISISDFFRYQKDIKKFQISNILAGETDSGKLQMLAKPVMLECQNVNRRALEIQISAKQITDVVVIELIGKKSSKKEIFLDKNDITVIFALSDIKKISDDDLRIFIGHQTVNLSYIDELSSKISSLKKIKTKSLVPSRKTPSLIPSRKNRAQIATEKRIPMKSPTKEESDFNLKKLETKVHRKWGQKITADNSIGSDDPLTDDPMESDGYPASDIRLRKRHQELPKQNYDSELIFTENFPL